MCDSSSDNSSDDEYCSSYATLAKKTYQDAKELASTVGKKTDALLNGTIIDPEKENISVDDVSLYSTSTDDEKEKSRRNATKARGRPAKTKRTRNRAKCIDGNDSVLSSGNESVDSLMESLGNDMSHNLSNLSPSSENKRKSRRNTRKKIVKETVVLVSSDEELKSCPVSPEIRKRPCIESNELMSIKVCWKYSEPIQKFQLRRFQKFQQILEHFAKLEGVPVEQVVLYGGKDNLRSIEPYDTPDSIGYTITDVLEGGTLSKESVTQSSIAKRYRDPSSIGGEEIELRLQLEQIRSFPLLIKKEQPMKILLVKVAEQLETEEDKIKLLLDGEVIDLESTPQDHDLEDGDVLDVLLSKPVAKPAKTPVKSSITPKPRSSKRPMRRCRK